jgi:hypothetical protein
MMFVSTWYVETNGSWSAVLEDDARKGELRVMPSGRGRNRSYAWEVHRPVVRHGVQTISGVSRSLDGAKTDAEAAAQLLGKPVPA